MVRVHIERGRIIKVPSRVVEVFFDNPDLVIPLFSKGWSVKKEKEDAYSGKKYGIEGFGEVVSKTKEGHRGTAKILVTVTGVSLIGKILLKLLGGGKISAIGTFEYSPTDDGNTFCGYQIEPEAFGVAGLLMKINSSQVFKIADELIDEASRILESVYDNPEKIKEQLSPEQQKILDKYLAGETSLAVSESARKSSYNGILHVIPTGKKAIVRLETPIPKPMKLREEILVSEKVKTVRESFSKIIETGNVFASIARGTAERKDAALSSKGGEFYSGAIALGRTLYTSYVQGNIHAYLTPMLDYGYEVQLKIDVEGEESILPWELLHNGEDFLCLRIGVARATSELLKITEPATNIKGILIVGSNPRDDLGQVESETTNIFNALKEIDEINVKLLVGKEATKEKVITELETGGYKALHFSGHSEFDAQNPRLSFLLLNGERKLTADELARLSTEEKLRLVFLNSCFSGVDQGMHIEISGLADAFVKTGVPYVLGMRWNVSDSGATILATEFYRSLIKLRDPVESLRRARHKVGQQFDWKDPSWAAPIIYAP